MKNSRKSAKYFLIIHACVIMGSMYAKILPNLDATFNMPAIRHVHWHRVQIRWKIVYARFAHLTVDKTKNSRGGSRFNTQTQSCIVQLSISFHLHCKSCAQPIVLHIWRIIQRCRHAYENNHGSKIQCAKIINF